MDCLNTVYRGNQIQRTGNVGGGNYDYDFPGYTDAADEETEVAYDANGNEIFNLDKEIVAIRYNVLNLPDTIQFANGNRIVNYYFAGGEKSGSVSRTYLTPLSVPLDEVTDSKDPHKDVSESKAGNLVCKNGSLSHILFDGGYFSLSRNYGGSMTNPKIYTYIRDHLGSIRLVCEGNTGEVVQSLEYFPSGLIFRSMCFEWQPYRFTGKELITEHGLNRYDSKARIQDFQIPGFTTLDPLCENYYGISPYSYCAGNPVRYIDSTGRWIESLWDVASLTIGAKSFVENVRQGNVKASVVDGLGMLLDLGAVILPGVPGGAGVAIKTGRTADKTAETLKAMERGRQSEKRVLQEMRATKNTKREMTTLETGEDITVIPDIVTPKNIMEIKDVKIVIIQNKLGENGK